MGMIGSRGIVHCEFGIRNLEFGIRNYKDLRLFALICGKKRISANSCNSWLNRLRSAAVCGLIFILSACNFGKSTTVDTAVPEKRPSLILLNSNVLNRTKNAVMHGDPAVMPAFNRLVADADKLLEETPHSVTDKKQTPPSGDKHDYMSMAPYWWPDPTKPDGLPYIRRDGEINPERDECTDRAYMQQMSESVQKLGLAYFFTDDERYAEHAAQLLKTWFINDATKMNPNLNYAQSIRGICDGRSIGIIDTRCLASMLDEVILLESSPSWTEADSKALKKWFSEYNEWLQTSRFGKDEDNYFNNHGTYFDYQSCIFSIYTGHIGDARARLDVVSRGRLDSQLSADGEQPFEMERTKPWGYSTGNIKGLVSLAVLGERVGVNLWEHVTPKGASIQKTIEWFFPYISGEKPFPKEEITNRRDAAELADVLMLTADRYGVDEYRKQLQNLIGFTGNEYDINTSTSILTNPILDDAVTSDAQLFDALDLNRKGLEKVKKDVAAGDYTAAKHDFVTYLKTRTSPKWFFDWRDYDKPEQRRSDYDRSYVDTIAANILPSSGLAYNYGDGIIDWSINPTEIKYVEWTWQLSRHGYWAELGRAYWATGDEKYARAFVHQMRSWVKFNPLPDYPDNDPYSRWRTIETGIRTLSAWPNAFMYFLGSPSFDDESIILMVKSFYEHGLHLRSFPQSNNWLTMEMDGLFNTGVMFPEFKTSADWCDFAVQKMYAEEQAQFYDDGAQIELAPGYHGVSLGSMMGIYKIGKLNNYPLPKDYAERLENMYNYGLNIIMPDGMFPAVNDAHWSQRPCSLSEGYAYMPHRTDFQYVATDGKEGTEPTFKSVWMSWAGWYIMRSGWDNNALYAHFEVGPYGAGHQHEDKLSFILHGYGSLLLTEGGKYDYDTSPWRNYVLSARAHNVTRVDGNDQNRNARKKEDLILHSRKPLENRWISNEQFDFGEGWYNEGFGPNSDSTVTQYRALTFIKNKYWLMIDIFTPSDAAEHTYTSWFHYDKPECKTNLKPLYALSTVPNAANLAIIPLNCAGLDLKVITGRETPEVQGWASGRLENGKGEKYICHEAATPEFTRRRKGQYAEPYLLYPIRNGEDMPIKDVKPSGDNTYQIFYNDGTTETIVFTINGNSLETLNITGKNGEIKVL